MTTGIGSILIAGLAALLICIFLGPKFIEEARAREFGQLIREEGPEGHHAKAGTPTMGGLLIFVSVSIPFLELGDYHAVSLAVGGTAVASTAADLYADYLELTPRRALRGDRVPCLHGDDRHHHGAGEPRAAGGVLRGRVRGLPVVQLVPRGRLHG